METKPAIISPQGNCQALPADHLYQCPGESYTISPAIHRARLAASYPACANCPHRTDTGTLSRRTVNRLQSVWRHRQERALIHTEAIAGRCGDDLDAKEAWKWGAALGTRLARELPEKALRIALGSDGRGLSAELVRAAGEGVRWSGAATIDCGPTTAPGTVFAQRLLAADGALLVGNDAGLVQTAGVRFWGPGGRPWSSPGELDALGRLVSEGIDRPGRKSGAACRQPAHAEYLLVLRECYHALRPVKFVLDTVSRQTMADLSALLQHVACRMVPARHNAEKPPAGASPFDADACAAAQVRSQRLDFGVWIDGDGEACRVWDESGAPIAGETLLAALADSAGENLPRDIVLESDSQKAIVRSFRGRGFRVHTGGTTRQSMYDKIARLDRAWGGGPSGRLWLTQPAPAPDALWTLTLLLQVLSRSDRPLSQVVADSLAVRGPNG